MTDHGRRITDSPLALPDAAPPFRFGPRAVESPSPGTLIAMIRTPLLCATVFVGLAACAVAQRRPAAPARSDTGPTAPPSAPKDSLTRFLESFSYRNLGPAAYSGRVTALAVPSPRAGSYPNTFYVGAAGGGVWKTTNGGTTWQPVAEGLGTETIGDLAVAPSDTSGFVDLEMDPSNPDVLYAAAWHRLRWGGGHMQGVGKGSGIYKTADGGRSWTKLTDPTLKNGLPTERLGRIGLAVSAKDPRVLYAVIQVDRGVTDPQQGRYGGVFRSADAGATWTQGNDLQAIPHYYYDDVWVDQANPDHIWTVSPSLLESKDGGKSFAPDSLHLVHGDYHALWIDPADPGHLIIGNDGGVYASRDGGKAWEHMAIPIGQFYTVIVDSSLTPYQVCGGLQDNGVWCGPSRTRDTLGITDEDWYPVNGGDGMWVQIPANDPFTVYSGWQYGHLSRLDLRTWKRDDITPLALDAGQDSGYPLTWGWTTPILVSQHDPTVLYVGANHLIRMTHRGDDWELLGPDMTRARREHPAPEVGHTSYHAVFAIAESPRAAGVVWAGSDDGLVWSTRDGGKTWGEVSGNLPRGAPTACWVAAIAASYHAERTAYLVYDCHSRDDYQPHVYRTDDFGKTWTEIGQGLPKDAGSLTICEDPANARLLWVGTATGVWVTADGGKTWRRFGKNLPNVPVEAMEIGRAHV